MATEDGAGVAATLIAETRAIAAGHGYAPRPAAVAQGLTRTLRDPQSRWAASMMRDIQQGAPRLEAEHVIGDLLRRGRQVEVAAPLLGGRLCPSAGLQCSRRRASGMIAALHPASISPCLRALASLAHVLAKGEAQCAARSIDPATLLQARLHPEMFPLVRQVQIASRHFGDPARRPARRHRRHPSTPDTETNFAELQAPASPGRSLPGGACKPGSRGGQEARAPWKDPLRQGATALSGLGYLHKGVLPYRRSILTWSPPTRSCATTASTSASVISSVT